MKPKKCERFVGFIKEIWPIILVVVLPLVAVPLSASYSLPYTNPIISGFFILLSAVVAAVLAIQKYHDEQRTSRLQKLYFEDTLLGQAKSIEDMMSQTTHNMLIIENLYSLALNILDQKIIDLDTKKLEILNSLEMVINSIKSDIASKPFKRDNFKIII